MNLEDITRKEWEDLYAQLYAYTNHLLKSYIWFRCGPKDVYLKGKGPKDYVLEAITRFLEHPEKFDPSKRTLAGYLKKHLIRTLVGDDARSKENNVSNDGLARRMRHNGVADDDRLVDFMQSADNLFEDGLDYETIISDVRKEIERDEPAMVIFESVCCEGKKRTEVIKAEGWSNDIFDNGMKRLDRVRVRVAKKYELKPRK